MPRRGHWLICAFIVCVSICGAAISQTNEQQTSDPPHLLPGESEPMGPANAAGQQPWQVQKIGMEERPAHILASGPIVPLSSVRIATANDTWYVLVDCDAGLCAKRITAPHANEQLPPDALPGSHVTFGGGFIARAWFADPTQRIEGSAIGPWVAGALVVQDKATQKYRIDLGLDQAFEDLRPRIADIDGNGDQTLFAVRSSVSQGSALIAVRLESGGLLHIIAETAPARQAKGWLNPVGIADFIGDGRKSVAVVASPDQHGELQLWDLSNHVFSNRIKVPGVSNHLPGQAIQDMAVVADYDGDGIADIAVPNASRTTIRILTFAHGRVGEPADIALPSPVATEIVGIRGQVGKPPMLLMGLEDGELVLLH